MLARNAAAGICWLCISQQCRACGVQCEIRPYAYACRQTLGLPALFFFPFFNPTLPDTPHSLFPSPPRSPRSLPPQVGDWLLFPAMGAYTLCGASKFNGIDATAATTFYVASRH